MNRRGFLKRSAVVVPAGAALAVGITPSAEAKVSGPQGAMIEVSAALLSSDGYYKWYPISDDHTCMTRVPRQDLDDQAWLREEQVNVVHFCDPEAYWTAVKARDMCASSKYVGYVFGGTCVECGYVPEQIGIPGGKGQLKLTP